MWVAIIRALALLLGLSIFTFGGTSEKIVNVITEPVKEIKSTAFAITPLVLLVIGALAWKQWQ